MSKVTVSYTDSKLGYNSVAILQYPISHWKCSDRRVRSRKTRLPTFFFWSEQRSIAVMLTDS